MQLTQEEEFSNNEKTFYQDTNIKVTQARFIAGDKTYAMRNTPSVSLFKIHRNPFFPAVFIILGFLFFISEYLVLLGLITIIIGFVVMLASKDSYSVRVSTNAGDTNSFVSKDQSYIQKIVDAVNDAMIYIS